MRPRQKVASSKKDNKNSRKYWNNSLEKPKDEGILRLFRKIKSERILKEDKKQRNRGYVRKKSKSKYY